MTTTETPKREIKTHAKSGLKYFNVPIHGGGELTFLVSGQALPETYFSGNQCEIDGTLPKRACSVITLDRLWLYRDEYWYEWDMNSKQIVYRYKDNRDCGIVRVGVKMIEHPNGDIAPMWCVFMAGDTIALGEPDSLSGDKAYLQAVSLIKARAEKENRLVEIVP